MKYFIVTYGCQMNVHESEKLSYILEHMGYEPCEKRENADIIVFNTCAVREGAEDRVFGNIGALKSLKKQNPNLIIAVCGCMTQKDETAKLIMQKYPFVDIVMGSFNLKLIESYIKAVQERRNLGKTELKRQKLSPRLKEIFDEGDIDEETPYNRTSLDDNAWVNIMQGCNNFCTYCIVPYVRGREKSRNMEKILSEIRDIVREGKYHKITLLGQNVNSYGKDLKDGSSFAKLLEEICKIDGDFKLTFMTSHPKDLTSDVIDTIAKEDKILKEIHLPAQSGNNRILKLMNRSYTREKYLEIIDEIKSKIKGVRLTSDFIVGFPSETEEEFCDTLDLVERVGYDSIFAFMYSKRSGTVAANMDNQIDEEVKRDRVNRLLKLSKRIQKEHE